MVGHQEFQHGRGFHAFKDGSGMFHGDGQGAEFACSAGDADFVHHAGKTVVITADPVAQGEPVGAWADVAPSRLCHAAKGSAVLKEGNPARAVICERHMGPFVVFKRRRFSGPPCLRIGAETEHRPHVPRAALVRRIQYPLVIRMGGVLFVNQKGVAVSFGNRIRADPHFKGKGPHG